MVNQPNNLVMALLASLGSGTNTLKSFSLVLLLLALSFIYFCNTSGVEGFSVSLGRWMGEETHSCGVCMCVCVCVCVLNRDVVLENPFLMRKKSLYENIYLKYVVFVQATVSASFMKHNIPF